MTIKYRDHTKTYITVQFILTFDCVFVLESIRVPVSPERTTGKPPTGTCN